jgi:hypothetical protein
MVGKKEIKSKAVWGLKIIGLIVLLVSVLFAYHCVVNLYIYYCYGWASYDTGYLESINVGIIGDSVAVVALVFLVHSVRINTKALQIQQKELELTRQEMRNQSEEMKKANDHREDQIKQYKRQIRSDKAKFYNALHSELKINLLKIDDMFVYDRNFDFGQEIILEDFSWRNFLANIGLLNMELTFRDSIVSIYVNIKKINEDKPVTLNTLGSSISMPYYRENRKILLEKIREQINGNLLSFENFLQGLTKED